MPRVTTSELAALLQEIQQQLTDLSARVRALESPDGKGTAPTPIAAPTPAATLDRGKSAAITEEELLAISAAVAAYLGVRAHIRQIRLISSPAWVQEGRATIQASHRLHS